MTPIGHSLAGATIGLLAISEHGSRRRKVFVFGACVIAANLPDAPLPGWGHQRYDISHSLFVSLGLIAPAATVILCCPTTRRAAGGIRVVLCVAVAWLSHLLLDSFYNHGLGIAIFWPISSGRLCLPIPWFGNLNRSGISFDAHCLRVMAVELAFFGTLFVVVSVIRHVVRMRVSSAKGAAETLRCGGDGHLRP